MSGLEAVSAAAGVVQLVDIGMRLAVILFKVCQSLRDAPSKLEKRLQSIQQLVEITKSIEFTSALDKKLIRQVVSSTTGSAQALLDLLEPLAAKSHDGRHVKYWKACCSATKEKQIIDLVDELEERKTELILCIGVATSSTLSAVDKRVLDLVHNTSISLGRIPGIEQTVEEIANKLKSIVLEGRLIESGQSSASTVATLQTVQLALPRLDDKLNEAGSLQRAIFELAKSIKNSLEPGTMSGASESLTPAASPNLSASIPNTSCSNPSDNAVHSHHCHTTERHFFVPFSQNALFTGRNETLEQISTYFSSHNHHHHHHHEQRRLVLTGLGGVGKTQIAIAYAYSCYVGRVYSSIFWIFASHQEQTIKSMTRVAKLLGLEAEPALASEHEQAGAIPPIVGALIQWLSREQAPNWLLIFDNVDDLDTFDVSDFFPKVPWGNILITSRRQQAARFGQQMTIDIMQLGEAVELLQRCSRLDSTSNDAAVPDVAVALGHLPLALDQAGAYIAEQAIDFVTYLNIYKDSKEHLLRQKPPKAVWSYEETVFTTWEISFSAILRSDPLAARLCDIAAFFNSDDVPLELLCALAQEPVPDQRLLLHDFVDFMSNRSSYAQIMGPLGDEFQVPIYRVQSAIGQLCSLSLVRRKAQSQSVSIHPLVHFWLRERQGETERARHARDAIRLTLFALFNAYDLSQFSKAEIIYPYVFFLLEQISAMPGTLDATEIHRIGACMIALDMWVPISFDAGTLLKADRFYGLAHEHKRQAVWTIPEAMLMMRQALRLKSLGLHTKTCQLCDQYFHVFEQKTRLDKVYAASMVRTAGPCYFRQGDYDGAERAYKRIDDSLDLTGVMLARKQLVLGAIKIDRGLPHEGEALLLSCISRLRQGIGEDHFLLSVWHWLITLSYIAQDRYQEAEAIIRPRLMKRFEQLTEGKIRFAFSDYELTEAYVRVLREQMRFTEAISFLEDLLAKIGAQTGSKPSSPARALGELSLSVTRLEMAIASVLDGADVSEQGSRVTHAQELLWRALGAFDDASHAYTMEWNRGTWVFKHTPTMLRRHQRFLEQFASG